VNGDAGGFVTIPTVAIGIFAFAVTLEQLRSIPAATQPDDGVSVIEAICGVIVIVTFGDIATDCADAASTTPKVNVKNNAITLDMFYPYCVAEIVILWMVPPSPFTPSPMGLTIILFPDNANVPPSSKFGASNPIVPVN